MQRFQNACVRAETRGGCKDFRLGSGALLGDKIAADLFRLDYQEKLGEFQSDAQAQMGVICFQHPIDLQCVGVSLSVYADDVYEATVHDSNKSEDIEDD